MGEVHASVSLALEAPDEEEAPRDPSIPLTRLQTWEDCAISTTLTPQQRQELRALLESCSSVFSDLPGLTTSVQHSIVLREPENLRLQHSYPLPLALEPQLQENLQQWRELGIVEPSTSPYCSPLLAVRKKDGTHRFCLDCRLLNSQTLFDSEPIADPTAIFSELARAHYLSKLDLASGYWQISLTEASRPLTAFKTRSGLFQFRVMPFGLANAPACFSRLMRTVTRGTTHVHAYLDDLLVATETWEQHLGALQQLLLSLQQHGLTAKPSKCELGFHQIPYLGHKIGGGECQPLEDKVRALSQSDLPKNKSQLRSFLGSLGYYQRFIPHYADRTAPLVQFLKKGAPEVIQWTDVTIDLFQALRELLLTSPILQLPDASLPFVLRTDASNEGLGAVLLQPNLRDPRVLSPVAFASRVLKSAEKNYSTVEKEALCVYWALQKFEIYLYGRYFELQTDHRPLLYLQSADRLNPRLKRWALYIGIFQFQASHIRGEENHLPDYLSRQPLASTSGGAC